MVDRAARFKRIARKKRAIPGQLGLRPHRVFLRNRLWDEGGFGSGSTVAEVEILETAHPPKVRQLNDERLALGGLAQGSVEIGPITTPHDGLGITAEQLRGTSMTQYDTLSLRISGPLGDAIYNVKGLTMDRAMHWKIIASPLAGAP